MFYSGMVKHADMKIAVLNEKALFTVTRKQEAQHTTLGGHMVKHHGWAEGRGSERESLFLVFSLGRIVEGSVSRFRISYFE